jgi:hypothetical protein
VEVASSGKTQAAMSTRPLPAGSVNVTTPPLVGDVIPGDGSTLPLVAPEPEHYRDVKAFYDALSSESRW